MSIFEQLGSLTAVKKLAEEFYDVMETDPEVIELRAIHPGKLHSSRKALYKFMSEWFGGPTLYGEQYINATWLELRHRRFCINDQQRDQWLYCMNKAMVNLQYESKLRNLMLGRFSDMIKSMQLQRRHVEQEKAEQMARIR
ncbi:MAG: hypothetical protein KTR18_03315 [Acidiferrobacterales bacterium]|nr:hypothetical protein [Acidiferrobacterales bacterium]